MPKRLKGPLLDPFAKRRPPSPRPKHRRPSIRPKDFDRGRNAHIRLPNSYHPLNLFSDSYGATSAGACRVCSRMIYLCDFLDMFRGDPSITGLLRVDACFFQQSSVVTLAMPHHSRILNGVARLHEEHIVQENLTWVSTVSKSRRHHEW
jgi:hypothetical protein